MSAESPPLSDRFDDMLAWEAGKLTLDETIELFQWLVDSGRAWRLQGTYGRAANALINAGEISRPDLRTTPLSNNGDRPCSQSQK